jgi:hypothetical protein
MKRFGNAILFQIVWFICVLAGSVWALVATIVYLLIHDRYFMHTRRELRLLVLFLGLGVLIDGTLFQIGLFSMTATSTGDNLLPPVWLLCLWISVGTLFAHSLSMLRSRYLLIALMGMIGPPLSYIAGAKLSGITLAEPIFLTLSVVALIWALILPLGMWFGERWTIFSEEK